ncbi:MAG TPA: putative baseplate assembly protein [Pseudonocardiaceae bacterium]
MALPAPNLDDRRFQDLVDEARRRVQQHCPQWTDHNVSDPGITLIETFAFMVEQVLYRLNRVPQVHYLRFLDLIGVTPFPPTAAACDVTFWLSAPRPLPVVIPAGNQVASGRTEVEEPVVFTVTDELTVPPCELAHLATGRYREDEVPVDRTDELAGGAEIACFAGTPVPGDTLFLGLSGPVPSCAVLVRVDCETKGHGIDPRDPPWEWDAWDGSGWTRCEVDHDTTGGFNRSGDVVLHVPPTHTTSVLARHRAGWLRCVLVEPGEGRPFYRESPRLRGITVATIGGTVRAVHADVVRDEVLGSSEGVHGQSFPLGRTPVVNDDGFTVEVSGDDGWQEWTEVSSFASSGPSDRHVRVDRVAGLVTFGPAIRQEDGTLRFHGAAPPKGATVRVPRYACGGGVRGNVARGVLRVHRDPVPFVSRVTNRRPATGGVDGESVTDAAARGPLLLRTRDRAVTVEDYEHLVREVAPEVARVRCVADHEQHAVRVLVVPAVPDGARTEFAALEPGRELRERITRFLDERRCVGARVSVEPPFYQGVTVVAELRAARRASTDLVRARAIDALHAYLDPVRGGSHSTGWPFGRPVQAGEIFAVLQRVSGVDLVEDVRLFRADPRTGERGGAVQRLDLAPGALVFSFAHQVRVTRG